MYSPTKYDLECDIYNMCVSEGALSRTNTLLDYLYSELDINDYLDVLEYTMGYIDLVDEDLSTIVAKIYRVALDKDY